MRANAGVWRALRFSPFVVLLAGVPLADARGQPAPAPRAGVQAVARATGGDANVNALEGLLPLAALPGTAAGREALAVNFAVTGGIQAGTLAQPLLLPRADQERLAVSDAFITGGNATQLADALGSRLGPVYQSLARYDDPKRFTSVSPAVALLIGYTNETTASDSNAGKYFFANGTLDGKKPVPDAAAGLLAGAAAPDVFGRSYGKPAGSEGSDVYGNPRPFQTLPSLKAITGPNYFGEASDNAAYLRGPEQDLRDSPAFPSGHTTYGTMESLLLALLVPERFEQAVTRGAEYGNNRIILGAHYAADVIAGRTLAMHDVAHLLANDPAYVGKARRAGAVPDYRAALAAARDDLRAALARGCGDTVAACAATDTGRFADGAANEALVLATLTYGLPVVYPDHVAPVDVAAVAPEAGLLLVAAFPFLSQAQANAILTETQGPGGGFLDNGSEFGAYSRLNLVAAARKARSLAPTQ